MASSPIEAVPVGNTTSGAGIVGLLDKELAGEIATELVTIAPSEFVLIDMETMGSGTGESCVGD
jgi:hypothetical protein